MENHKERYQRRRARKLGFLLRKSRVKTTHLDNQGGYLIMDFDDRIRAGEKFDLTLEDVTKFLDGMEEKK